MSHPVATWPLAPDATPVVTELETGATPEHNEPIDLLLDDDGDLVVDTDAHFSAGLVAVAQGVRLRIEEVQGEWFADLDRGVDWFGVILGQKFDETLIRAEFRATLLGAPGVNAIDTLDVNFDRGSRELSVSWRIVTDLGSLVDEVRVQF